MISINYIFGLVATFGVNEILVLLAQTIVHFPLYPIILRLVRTHFECKTLQEYPFILAKTESRLQSHFSVPMNYTPAF